MVTILLIIQLLFLSVSAELIGGLLDGLLSGIHGNVEPEPAKPEDCPTNCPKTCYRTFNGTCNNLRNPLWGAPGTLFSRMFDTYSYEDGKCKLPCLPNPRKISLNFVDIKKEDPIWTLFTPMFGQMLAHDMSMASGVPQTGAQAIQCQCVDGKLKKKHKANKRCSPIEIPKWDPYCTPEGVECYNFIRTRSTCDDECPTVPGEQYTAVTSYIDCSPLYGNNDEQANNLRKFKYGMLDYIKIDGRMYPPQVKDPRVCNDEGASRPLCIMTGDFRANQNPHIALLQIVLLRYHNKIAKKLCKHINPHWDDTRCFEETRRIVIGTCQNIAYYEYLPFMLGRKNMIKHGLIESHPKCYVDGYDDTIDPSAINEHATAASRMIHSSLAGHLKLYDENRKPHGVVRMSNVFNNASLLLDCETELYLAIGAAYQRQLLVDRLFDSEYTQYLFRRKGAALGLDLMALDVQRARDHGLAPYADAMKKCGLGHPKCFDDFKYISPENREILKRIYDSYDQVELRVGGQLETVGPGQLCGPTFLCIMLKQFYNTKFGDRFWYEFEQECPFTEDQLKEIRAQTMAKLMCKNAGDFPIQPRAFEVPSSDNEIGLCSDLPCIDLSKWKEEC